MERINIETQVEIPPMYLDQYISSHILMQLKKKYENKCTKSIGFIQKVDKINFIKDNIISRTTANILFKVNFEIERFLPLEGKVISGVVQTVNPKGVILGCKGIRTFVPSSKTVSFVYKDPKEVVINKQTVKQGDEITVTIATFKYEKNSFTMIGSML
jgi:DNA-directed RNA polymerase subunit E'/Rpb7